MLICRLECWRNWQSRRIETKKVGLVMQPQPEAKGPNSLWEGWHTFTPKGWRIRNLMSMVSLMAWHDVHASPRRARCIQKQITPFCIFIPFKAPAYWVVDLRWGHFSPSQFAGLHDSLLWHHPHRQGQLCTSPLIS